MSYTESDKEKILKQQQKTTAQLNALLEKSAEAIMCGPTCQKMKQTQELEQKYLNAQTNMQTAPIKLEDARKAYYTFKSGVGAYNTMLETDLKKKADEIAKQLSEKFTEHVDLANTLNTYYNSDLINSKNTEELYENYLQKNKEMEKRIQNTRGDVVTNDRKTYYESQEQYNLFFWYRIFMTTYYLLLVVFMLGIIFSPNKLSRPLKIGITLLLFIYPFIIPPISAYLVNLINGILVYLFPKNVYYKV
jgi:hypothetical protein